jgi:hypothetical protein
VCLLCSMSERECSFASQPDPPHSRRSPIPLAASPGPVLDLDPEAINFTHAELMTHLVTHKEMYSLSVRVGDYSSRLSLALRSALESPYLMYQLLAFSARHLAHLHPDRAAFYQHQAVTLQTRGLSLFNSARRHQIAAVNCVALLLYSSVLAHHLLTDMLHASETQLESFIGRYAQCVEMHRGIITVSSAAWPLLNHTELQPVLSGSAEVMNRTPQGTHCQRLYDMLDASTLDLPAKEVLREAVPLLQVGFDLALDREEPRYDEDNGVRYHMIFCWMLKLSPEYIRMLTERQPEALVIMTYYALLLHYGRSSWQVGNSGQHLMQLIGDYLGSDYNDWLEYPRQMMAADMKHRQREP